MSETPKATEIATPDDLRGVLVAQMSGTPFDPDVGARVLGLAGEIEALQRAVQGCGVGSDANGYVCGSLPDRPTGPRLCRACSLNAWNAIATLTHAGDE